ncbi:related to dihydrodipicolinate synthetase family protein [Cephalotrichum gorgonifer]|uniref:Related to dihydrodipicolinate synthetase family protein n=1 Tax=Cephalotrichum gorgonifer TaxID=2041049 RepID=A0AAE8N108_9PEZI|nr:related to dihydrodipicolinate synthetase family protein [Cephalotrichum gorgonifer]
MSSQPYRPLPKGIYTPLPTFFLPNEDLDIPAFAAHVHYVAAAGTIPVVIGSAGEAPHLTSPERTQLIQTARKALDDGGLSDVPVVAGVGAPSTRETIRFAHGAAEAGADYAMVLPSGYYAGQVSGRGGAPLRKYLIDVAEASPIPVVLYNFPGVSAGIDIDSDMIVDVMKASGNVVGVKLTCASVGKITRINAVVSTPAFRQKYPRRRPDQEFQVIDGFIDILLPSIASGAAGAISGLPNFVPRTCVRLWELSSSSVPGTDDYREAQRLQGLLALADGACQKIGIAGLKMLVHKVRGHSELPRRPLLPMDKEEGAALVSGEAIQAVLAEEKILAEGK